MADVLKLTFRPGETWTFKLPDGQQAHAYVESVADRTVRIAFVMPDELRVARDTLGASKVFEHYKK